MTKAPAHPGGAFLCAWAESGGVPALFAKPEGWPLLKAPGGALVRSGT